MPGQSTQGPTYEALRPLHPVATSATFPVYPDLATRLIEAGDADPVAAHVLATCSGYAYSDEETVAMIMTRLGLERSRCVRVSETIDAMFVCSTGFVIQSEDGRVVILCYRGTEPVNFASWLTDLDVSPDRVRYDLDRSAGDEDYLVHAGFYRNVRATRYAVVELLDRALRGRSILDEGEAAGKLEALYVTGHSLGGAMAAMMTVMLGSKSIYAPIADKLKATYTYGQPMIGSAAFARSCGQALLGRPEPPLQHKLFRFVYGDDVIPQLPPRESGSFAHFGIELRCRPGDTATARPEWTRPRRPTDQTGLIGLTLSGLPLLTQQFKVLRHVPFAASLADHVPHHYIDALRPPGVRSEFGD